MSAEKAVLFFIVTIKVTNKGLRTCQAWHFSVLGGKMF